MDPVLEGSDIQGNIIPGFSRARQLFVALQADAPQQLTAGLKALSGKVTTLVETLAHKAQRKAAFLAAAPIPQSDALWLNVAIGSQALNQLGALGAERRDLAFRTGMIPARTGDCSSDLLPDGSPNPSHPRHWRLGGPNARVDLLCIFASDSDVVADSAATVALLKAAGLRVIFSDVCEVLNGNVEHFGFVDGISVPGPRGVVDVDGELRQVTTRYGVPAQDGREFGKPGQLLADPEQFICHDDPDGVMRNGSFLVLRRLSQDVSGFYRDTDQIARQLSSDLVQPITGAELRARIIGRWPSGQPLMRPVSDPATPEDMLALNHFGFLAPSPAVVLSDETHIPASAADRAPYRGLRCPIWSHIRKVNPRDLGTNLGGPDDTAGFQMLRRGIPFGPAYDHDNAQAPTNAIERGLMFVAYQTSISTQFENLNSNWMNTYDGPADGGFDLLVGQRLLAGLHAEKEADFNQPGTAPTIAFHAMSQWVKPTGGAYLFSPGIAALATLAG